MIVIRQLYSKVREICENPTSKIIGKYASQENVSSKHSNDDLNDHKVSFISFLISPS